MGNWRTTWRWVSHLSTAQWVFSLMFPAVTLAVVFKFLAQMPTGLSIAYGVMIGLACFIVWHVGQWIKRQNIRPSFPAVEFKNNTEEMARKRQIINDCRKLIVDWGFDNNHREQRIYLEKNLSFLALKKHLGANFMAVYDKRTLAIITPMEANPRPYLMRCLGNELDRLETEWMLDG